MQFQIPKPNIQKTFGEITYFGCATGDICLLNWHEGTIKTNSMHKENHPVQAIAFDDKYIYSGGWDKKIFRYKKDTLEFDQNCFFYANDMNPIAHTDYIKSLCMSSDGKYLYSGSADGEVARWMIPGEVDKITHLQPIRKTLFNRFVNSIVELNDKQIICGGSNHVLYLLDRETLKIEKEHKLALTSNIKRIIIRGQLIFILTKDILVLDRDFTLKYLFVLKKEPVDLYFPPTSPELFYAACEDGIKIIKFEQSAPLDYYEKLGANGRQWDAEKVKQLFTVDQAETYEVIPSGTAKPLCGLECVKQHISWHGIERDCYMLIYGSSDEMARRIFFFPEDREAFTKILQEKQKKEEEEQSSAMDSEELDKISVEEIQQARLRAMLAGRDDWHRKDFTE